MKVLQINSVCGYGSTGRIATDLYDEIIKEGHECCIAYGRGKVPLNYKTIKIGNNIDLFFHVIKTRLFDLHGLGSRRATKHLIKQIEKFNPDVIHLHNIHGYYVNVEILFNYLSTLSIPIVWLLHDAWTISGHSAHFELNDKDEIPNKNMGKQQHKEYPKSLWIDNSQNNFLFKKKLFTKLTNLTIVTPSIWLGELVEKSYLSKYEIKVIHNGIDLKMFKPIEKKIYSELKNKKILLGVASVWSDKKGLNIFSELSKKLDDSFKIILVGLDRSQIKNIGSNIICIPRTGNLEELVEIYNLADIFINPTLEDNFPTTNIESLACGIPVITFDTGGSSESLSSQTGIVIEKGNVEKLEEAIRSFDYNFDYQSVCVSRANIFDKNMMYKEYLDLYQKLVIKRNDCNGT